MVPPLPLICWFRSAIIATESKPGDMYQLGAMRWFGCGLAGSVVTSGGTSFSSATEHRPKREFRVGKVSLCRACG